MAGKWPALVLPQFCRTDIQLSIYSEDIDEDGAPIIQAIYTGKCNYQGSSKRIRTDKETFVQITAVCLFNGDILPDVVEIHSGTAIVFGENRTIVSGRKSRNPDGTVNFTEVDLV